MSMLWLEKIKNDFFQTCGAVWLLAFDTGRLAIISYVVSNSQFSIELDQGEKVFSLLSMIKKNLLGNPMISTYAT